MSTALNDLASATALATGVAPGAQTASVNGSAIDMITADGPCFAVQQVGAVSGTSPSLAGRIDESPDGTTWTSINGATFTAVTASNDLQVIRFTRTQRYVRWGATINGTTPSFAVAVLIGEQKKTF